jgi:large subunit ribosomal protein L23
MELSDVLITPVLTEKSSSAMTGTFPVVTFKVHPAATKTRVREAVEKILGAEVLAVRIMHCRGKRRRMGRHTGKTSAWKKAIVKLKEGSKIEALGSVMP